MTATGGAIVGSTIATVGPAVCESMATAALTAEATTYFTTGAGLALSESLMAAEGVSLAEAVAALAA